MRPSTPTVDRDTGLFIPPVRAWLTTPGSGGSLGAPYEVAQCLKVRLGFLEVGQVAAVFEHDEFGIRHQAAVPGGVLGSG
jgi:hypothetical protein